MDARKTLLAGCIVMAVLAACKKQDATADTETAAPARAAQAQAEPALVEDTPATDTPAATPAAAAFDINAIAVSDKPLPAWPYVALPAGYHYYHADDMAGRTKDLARVPAWTGGQLLWVEGKVFSDSLRNDDGKTFSKFELRKNLQQAVEAMGGVRLSERSYDEATYKANEKEVEDFRQEFDRIRDAYWYDSDADTWVIRRADKAIWVVYQVDNSDGGLMIAESPLPEAPSK